MLSRTMFQLQPATLIQLSQSDPVVLIRRLVDQGDDFLLVDRVRREVRRGSWIHDAYNARTSV